MTSWVIGVAFFVIMFAQSSKAFDWQDNNGGPVRWAKNCSFEGNGTSEKRLNTFGKCGDLCLETRNCDHFTWTASQGGNCILQYSNRSIQSSLKFQTLAVNETESDSVCGFLQISWNKDANNTSLGISDWGYNCLVLGLLTGKFLPPQVTKMEECGGLCKNNSECSGFTWKPDSEWCLMATGGVISKDFVLYDPHSFCGVIDGRDSRYLWLYVLLAIISGCVLVFIIRAKIIKMFRPRYSRR